MPNEQVLILLEIYIAMWMFTLCGVTSDGITRKIMLGLAFVAYVLYRYAYGLQAS